MRRFSGRKIAMVAAPLALAAVVAVPTTSSAIDLPIIGGILGGVLDIDDLAGGDAPFVDDATLVKLCVLDGEVVDITAIGEDDCDDEVAAVQGPKGDKGDKGDQGIQGIQGVAGLKGANGADGEDGVSGYKMIKTPFSVGKKSVKSLQVGCGGSLKVTGGGVYSSSNSIVPLANHPAADGKSWKARVANTSGSTKTVYVYAICASV